MAGNRFDMIERAAARLRRDAPAQKPVIDQSAPQSITTALATEPPPPQQQQQPFVRPAPDGDTSRQPQQPRQLINNLQPFNRQLHPRPADDEAPMPAAPPV